MNRAALTALGALLILGGTLSVALAAPTLKSPDKSKSYYATRLGTTLVYDDGGREHTWEVTAVEEKDGDTFVEMSVVSADGKFPLERVRVSSKGVFLLEAGKHKLDPVCNLKLPAKVGSTWDTHVAAQPGLLGQSATLTVVGTEEVEVPAGKFHAVRVEMVETARNGVQLDEPLKYTKWFDPELGVVKMTGKDGFSRVLKSVTWPGKKK